MGKGDGRMEGGRMKRDTKTKRGTKTKLGTKGTRNGVITGGSDEDDRPSSPPSKHCARTCKNETNRNETNDQRDGYVPRTKQQAATRFGNASLTKLAQSKADGWRFDEQCLAAPCHCVDDNADDLWGRFTQDDAMLLGGGTEHEREHEPGRRDRARATRGALAVASMILADWRVRAWGRKPHARHVDNNGRKGGISASSRLASLQIAINGFALTSCAHTLSFSSAIWVGSGAIRHVAALEVDVNRYVPVSPLLSVRAQRCPSHLAGSQQQFTAHC
ncbi:hypothetical protein AB1N83_013931 [Pleurotus pulmonarius]